MRRLLVWLALAILISPSLGAGNGNGNAGNGNAYGRENGNEPSNGKGNGNSQGENGENGDIGGNQILSPEGLVTIAPDQNQAIDAVGSGALPLSDISDRAVAQWGGRVIDAKLLRRNGVLVYRLTMLTDQGVSRRVLYDARTGAPLGGR